MEVDAERSGFVREDVTFGRQDCENTVRVVTPNSSHSPLGKQRNGKRQDFAQKAK